MTAQAWLSLIEIEVAPFRPGMSTGDERSVLVPSPTTPPAFPPQQRTVVSLSVAQLAKPVVAASAVTCRHAPLTQPISQVSVETHAVQSALQVSTFLPLHRVAPAVQVGAVQPPKPHSAADAQVSIDDDDCPSAAHCRKYLPVQ
jgi:hypothetical protein